MNILGLNGSIGWDGNIPLIILDGDMWVHGSGATLFRDGELKGALCEERLTRVKYDGRYPFNSINHLLNQENLTFDDIDVVGMVTNATRMGYELKKAGYIEDELRKTFRNAKVEFVDHHLAHASASYYSSGFEESLIFTFDGAGDLHETPAGPMLNNSKLYMGRDKTIEDIFVTYLPDNINSFGRFYSTWSFICYELKTNPNPDMTKYRSPISRETYPGKIMGLSAYGDYKKVDLPDPFELKFHNKFPLIIEKSLDRDASFIVDRYSPEDLSAWMQHHFEKYVTLFFENLPSSMRTDTLCLGGGCSLNIMTNSLLVEKGIFKDVYINTAPNDDGLSFGSAIYLANKTENKVKLPHNLGCIGGEYNQNDYEVAKKHFEPAFSNIEETHYEDFDSLCDKVVDLLMDDNIVAWFQGKSEFGPRALGNRSIFVDPRKKQKEYLNSKVKFREYWRPYAPIMLESHLKEWYDIPIDSSPYMLFNGVVKKEKRGLIPSVTHADNSSRVQTVNEKYNEKVDTLLKKFLDKTNVPILLNTSFNVAGEPIVEKPFDALNTFFNSQINVLVINNNVLIKKL